MRLIIILVERTNDTALTKYQVSKSTFSCIPLDMGVSRESNES